MSTLKKLHTIDRSQWPKGPWDNEPEDKIQFRTAVGYPGLLVRNRSGVWCGYVSVTKGHPDYGVEYVDVPVTCHGGLTYSDTCADHICHVPEPGEPDDVWWLGFDTNHGGDRSPRDAYLADTIPEYGRYMDSGIYRTKDYARAEVELLAKQLKAREAR